MQEQEEAAPPAYDDRSSICTQSQCHPSKFRALGNDTTCSYADPVSTAPCLGDRVSVLATM